MGSRYLSPTHCHPDSWLIYKEDPPSPSSLHVEKVSGVVSQLRAGESVGKLEDVWFPGPGLGSSGSVLNSCLVLSLRYERMRGSHGYSVEGT